MEEKDLCIQLSQDATFVDLFAAIAAIESIEGLGSLHFEEELWDNFVEAVVEEVLAFQDPLSALASKEDTRLVDFFNGRGYTKEEIEIYLPIEFV